MYSRSRVQEEKSVYRKRSPCMGGGVRVQEEKPTKYYLLCLSYQLNIFFVVPVPRRIPVNLVLCLITHALPFPRVSWVSFSPYLHLATSEM